jgi:hypothetical protein
VRLTSEGERWDAALTHRIQQYLDVFTPSETKALEGEVRRLSLRKSQRTMDYNEKKRRTKYFFGYRYTVR